MVLETYAVVLTCWTLVRVEVPSFHGDSLVSICSNSGLFHASRGISGTFIAYIVITK